MRVVIPYQILEEIMTSTQFAMVTRAQARGALEKSRIISDHLPIVITVETP